jgi:hypothetical protein
MLFLIPWHCFYKTARLEFFKIIWEVLISPFSVVRFKHFIVADLMTSFVNPFKDLGYSSCFFLHGLWFDSSMPTFNTCKGLEDYTYIVMFVPFWFRFA